MRSEIIFRAKEIIANKYMLCQSVAKATRRLHISSANTQETINSAIERIASGSETFILAQGVGVLRPTIVCRASERVRLGLCN